MSDVTDAVTAILAKQRQRNYNAASVGSDDVRDALEVMNTKELHFPLSADDSNTGYSVMAEENLKLESAVFLCTGAVGIGNAAGNTVIFSVSVNGVEAVNVNTEAGDNVAAGGVFTLTVNTANSFVDGGETVQITTTTDEAADGAGTVVLRFSRQ